MSREDKRNMKNDLRDKKKTEDGTRLEGMRSYQLLVTGLMHCVTFRGL